MNPILLQKQLRDNNSDFQNFYKDLKAWGDEMKLKDESLKNPNKTEITEAVSSKQRKLESEPKKEKKKVRICEKVTKKTFVTDYTAWDKFDADQECQKLDKEEESDSELTDEFDETKRDEALIQKENGNKFVKKQQWDDAIKCYTKAIDYHPYDPIFYANRALCYLKKQNMEKAELDCNLSLKLDCSYVKAYQRRAAAREALNNLEGAEYDLQKVLDFEPNNKESKAALAKIEEKLKLCKITEVKKPISKFTASRQQQNKNLSHTLDNSANKVLTDDKTIDSSVDKTELSSDDNIIPIRAIKKPPHLQSKKPLKRIKIVEIDMTTNYSNTNENTVKPTKATSSINPLPKPNTYSETIKCDEFKVIERKPPVESTNNNYINKVQEEIGLNTTSNIGDGDKSEFSIYKKNRERNVNVNSTAGVAPNSQRFSVPKTSVQFYSCWRHLKNINAKYQYFKLIPAETLPIIFKESFESDVFSEFLNLLANSFISHNDNVFEYLLFLTQVKRFSTLTMFMSNEDKSCLEKLVDYMKEKQEVTSEDITNLIHLYEL